MENRLFNREGSPTLRVKTGKDL